MLGALIFDFDGLMVDTEWPSFQAWEALFQVHGARLALSQWVACVGSSGGFDPIAELERQLGHPVDRAGLLAQRAAHKAALVADAPLLPGVADRLAEARALGWRVGVASSSEAAWVHGHLARLGVLEALDAVRTREDVTQVKPAPELFLKTAAALGVAPAACVVLEDSLNGVRAARAAGMIAVAVPSRATAALDFGQDAHLRLESLEQLSLHRLAAAATRR